MGFCLMSASTMALRKELTKANLAQVRRAVELQEETAVSFEICKKLTVAKAVLKEHGHLGLYEELIKDRNLMNS